MSTEPFSINSALLGAQCPICKATGLRADAVRGQVINSGSGNTRAACNACSASFEWPACYGGVQPFFLSPEALKEFAAHDRPKYSAAYGQTEQIGWFTGRLSRGNFFISLIGFGLVEWAAVAGLGIAYGNIPWLDPLLWFTVFIVVAFKVWFLTLCAKRAHDFGWGSWTAVFSLPPLISWIWVLVLAFLPGTRSPNRYGPSLFKASLEILETSSEDRERDRARLVTLMDRNS